MGVPALSAAGGGCRLEYPIHADSKVENYLLCVEIGLESQLMVSKYNGSCFICTRPTVAGKDHYDLDAKKSYHEACTGRTLAEAHALADSLGFLPSGVSKYPIPDNRY